MNREPTGPERGGSPSRLRSPRRVFIDRIFLGWRFVTEPLTWLLLALLGSWWLKVGITLLQDLSGKSPRGVGR